MDEEVSGGRACHYMMRDDNGNVAFQNDGDALVAWRVFHVTCRMFLFLNKLGEG